MENKLKPQPVKLELSNISLASPCCDSSKTSAAPCCGPPPPSTGSSCGASNTPKDVPCCGPSADLNIEFEPARSVGSVESNAGAIPKVPDQLSSADRLGAFKVRMGIGRMTYGIKPGLYAVGSPDENSPVLVSANYKLSFDHLRSHLQNFDAWILVLDTKAVNVWCAAGKGTFGTDEIIARVAQTELARVVSHRNLIVPQLGAPGVAAHKVKQSTGFRVVFGPVEAADIKDFAASGLKATRKMRTKFFPFKERAVLIPMEFVPAAKVTLALSILFLVAGGLGSSSGYVDGVMRSGTLGVLMLTASLISGTVLFPLLLPYLPGRAFSTKGVWIGALGVGVTLALWGVDLSLWLHRLEGLAWILIGAAWTAFMAMNFTGASTYTNLSGVRKEMRVAVPLQIAAAAVGLALWIGARFVA